MDGALLRLYAATFMYALAMALGIPLVPEFLELEYAASYAFVGVVMGVYGVMQIFLRLPMGDMADRRGRRRSLLLAFASVFVAGLFFVFEQGPYWAFPGVAFFGFAGGIFWVAANSYLFDRVSGVAGSEDKPPRTDAGDASGRITVNAKRVSLAEPDSLRGNPNPSGTGGGAHASGPHTTTPAKGKPDIARATSDYTLMLSVAFLLGPLIGHYLVDRFSFKVAFSMFLWTSIAGFLLILTLPEAPRPYRPKPPGSPYTRAWRLLKHPALVLSAIGTFLYSSLFGTMNSFFQGHVLGLGAGVLLVGYLLAWRQGSALLVRLGLPKVLRHFGSVRVLFAGVVVAAVSTALVPFATTTLQLAAVVGLFGAATGVMIPANLMLVHEGAPENERGLANGIYGTMLGLGSGIAPATFGFLASLLDDRAWAFWIAGSVALIGVSALVLVQQRRARAESGAAGTSG